MSYQFSSCGLIVRLDTVLIQYCDFVCRTGSSNIIAIYLFRQSNVLIILLYTPAE